MQARSEQALHVGLEHSRGGCPFHGHRWPHPFSMETRKQRRVLAAVPRDLEERSPAYRRIATEGSQRKRCGRPSRRRTPAAQDRRGRSPCAIGSSRTRLFLLPLRIFFRLLRKRPTALQTVASLTLTPERANRNWALWKWVAHGRSSRSSTRSFIAFSSSFGLLPGAFLGSRVPRSSSCLFAVALDRRAIDPESAGGL